MLGDLKFGRRPPKRAPSLRLGDILAPVIPPHPEAEDYLSRFGSWQMLGNDQYGDCVAVTWANVRRLVTATIGDGERYPSMDDVIAVYKTQNPAFPAEDNGMDIQTLLEHLVSVGGPDGVKAVAFASVDTTNAAEVEAALAIFGYLWTGIEVEPENMADFGAGQPWDWHGTPPEGGHSVISGGYTGMSGNDVRFVTWGRETGFTDRFWAKGVEEAWVVVWPEHLGDKAFEAGIDQTALAAAYQTLTGRALPVAPPAPTPVTPPPAPAPPPGNTGCLGLAAMAVGAALALARG